VGGHRWQRGGVAGSDQQHYYRHAPCEDAYTSPSRGPGPDRPPRVADGTGRACGVAGHLRHPAPTRMLRGAGHESPARAPAPPEREDRTADRGKSQLSPPPRPPSSRTVLRGDHCGSGVSQKGKAPVLQERRQRTQIRGSRGHPSTRVHRPLSISSKTGGGRPWPATNVRPTPPLPHPISSPHTQTRGCGGARRIGSLPKGRLPPRPKQGAKDTG